jgi:hypothetical protein
MFNPSVLVSDVLRAGKSLHDLDVDELGWLNKNSLELPVICEEIEKEIVRRLNGGKQNTPEGV